KNSFVLCCSGPWPRLFWRSYFATPFCDGFREVVMQFEHLETLLLVPVSLFIMLAALVFHSRWTQRVRLRIQSGSALESMYATFSPQRRRLKQISFILAAIFIAIAAAQPQWGQTNKPVKRTG